MNSNEPIKMKPLIALFICLAAGVCGCSNAPQMVIDGTLHTDGYACALLATRVGTVLDSAVLTGRTFRLRLPVGTDSSRPVLIRLIDKAHPEDGTDVPVWAERGVVKLELGRHVRLSGTPLNESLQDFLDALQGCKDRVLARKPFCEDTVRATFSAFYLSQIKLHRHDALGPYIFETYGCHLLEPDAQAASALLRP